MSRGDTDTLALHAADYHDCLQALKARVREVQLQAAVAVNKELLRFYWALGAEIVERQNNTDWGSGFLQQLSKDLMAEFPGMKGFSLRNINYIRQWFLFYSGAAPNGQQSVAHLKAPEEALIAMIVRLKTTYPDYPDLSANQPYFVIGIEADDFRIFNDLGKPYLYPRALFDVIDSDQPADWLTDIGDDSEQYAYPAALNAPGFFRGLFRSKAQADRDLLA